MAEHAPISHRISLKIRPRFLNGRLIERGTASRNAKFRFVFAIPASIGPVLTMQTFLFHCGFMKTASSLLQVEVFPTLPDTKIYSYYSGFAHRAYALRHSPDRSDFDALIRDAREWAARSSEQLQLFSWEGLVGDYLADYRGFEILTDLVEAICEKPKILLAIRAQPDMCGSLYKQALHRGHFCTIDRFVNYRDGELGSWRAGPEANMDVRRLDFDATVQTYEDRFGAENVHVLVFEWLFQQRDRFFDTLSQALDRPVDPPPPDRSVNVGYNTRTAAIARMVNRAFRSPQNPRGFFPYRPFERQFHAQRRRGGGNRVVRKINDLFDPRTILQGVLNSRISGSSNLLPDPIREAIFAEMAESNRKLDARRGLGLGDLGYY